MKKKNLLISVGLTFTFIFYTFLVKVVDVKDIGPDHSKVGFSSINGWFHDTFDYSEVLYKLSEIFGILLLALAAIYGCIGLIQLIKKMSIKKVDKDLIMLGSFYVVVILVYLLFEELVINYRPVILEEGLEASYPSSHTVLALCVGLSSIFVSPKYVSKKYLKVTNAVTILLSISVLILRLLSGAHWLTDIIGGILISSALLSFFYTFYKPLIEKRNLNER